VGFGTGTDKQVHVAGGWNGWSDSASPLHKQADGTFSAEIALPWGEKQAFKYIVDGGECAPRAPEPGLPC
jgi:1,4-alpha-glucan branching enzyme